MLIIDSGTYKDCIALEELAQTLSLTKTARVCKRRYSDRPLKINKETGEIKPTKYGDDFKRDGAAFYHDVKVETEDTIKRFSYLAKVFSKFNSSFSSTRLPSQKKPETSEAVEAESH